MTRIPVLAASTLLLIAPAPGLAGSPHPCAVIKVDSERLACYDRTFGTPAEPRMMPEPAATSAAPTSFTAVVSKFERRNGRFVVTLDDGQVWVQSERDSRVHLESGETVAIRPASLGSWLLTGKQGIAARVKRQR